MAMNREIRAFPSSACVVKVGGAYENLLGTLDQAKTGVWTECLFVDPIADIAVLGCPEDQELGDEADAYYELTDNSPLLRIGNARSGRGWVLSLDGQWVRTTMMVFSGIYGSSLSIDPTKSGMSGSPVLNDAGRALGVVVLGDRDGRRERRAQEREGLGTAHTNAQPPRMAPLKGTISAGF